MFGRVPSSAHRVSLGRSIVLGGFLIASVAMGPTQVADAREPARDCFISVKLELSTRDGGPGRSRHIQVLPDCGVVVGDAQDAASHRATGKVEGRDPTCRLINRMHGIPGTWDTLTELTTYSTWYYDGTWVTAQGTGAGHWEQAVTGWYLTAGPTYWQNTYAPATSISSYTTGSFRNGGPYSWEHSKYNQVNVYGNGNCDGLYQHNGWVCGGCGVIAYLDVY